MLARRVFGENRVYIEFYRECVNEVVKKCKYKRCLKPENTMCCIG